MSVASVPGIIAALSMRPISPMLASTIAQACRSIAEASQSAPVEPTPAAAPGPAGGTTLDQRS
ncbi:MAG: hypothetical protein U1E34_02765 [Amaricoccus sp.]